MKKIHAITLVIVAALTLVFVADWVATKIYIPDTETHDSLMVDNVIFGPIGDRVGYSNEEYNFAFEYSSLLQVSAHKKINENILLRVEVTPTSDFLKGLNGLLTVDVSNTQWNTGKRTKGYVGSVEVDRYDYSIADGDFIRFEKKINNTEYIQIEIPKMYYDMDFSSDIYSDEETLELVSVSSALQEVINSFTFNTDF